jgi:hypothetical protein
LHGHEVTRSGYHAGIAPSPLYCEVKAGVKMFLTKARGFAAGGRTVIQSFRTECAE